MQKISSLVKLFSYLLAFIGIWLSIFLADIALSKKSLELGMENEIKTVSSLLAMALDKNTPMIDILMTANKVLDKSVIQELYFKVGEESKELLNIMLITDSDQLIDAIQRFTVVEIANKVVETTSLNTEKTSKKITIFNSSDEMIFSNNWISVDFESLYKTPNSYLTGSLLGIFSPEDPIKPIEFKNSCKAASSPIIFKKKSDPPFYDFTNDRRVVCKDIVSDENEKLGYVVFEDSYYQASFWQHLFKPGYALPFILLSTIFLLLMEIKDSAIRRQTKEIRKYTEELGNKKSVLTGTSPVPLTLNVDKRFRILAKSIRRLRNRLEHKDMLELDLQSIAHQLKGKLGDVAGKIENQKGGSSPLSTEETLNNISTKISKVRKLLDKLLDVAHLNTKDKLDTNERINLLELFKKSEKIHEKSLKEKNLHWRESIDYNISIDGDSSLLLEAFGNLIQNAIDHSPKGKTIEIQISENSESIIVKILNDGPAVSDEITRKIENNELVTSKINSNSLGCGLGIRWAKTVFQLHNGEFQLSSRHFRGGASALVTFATRFKKNTNK